MNEAPPFSDMEIFPAFDDDTLEYIKRVIDQSDHYVLIIAGRYGSISSDGLSFTEKEYDYAVFKKIPSWRSFMATLTIFL